MPGGPRPALPPCALAYAFNSRRSFRSESPPEVASGGPLTWKRESSSPEFEFRSAAGPEPVLLSADELFADGVLLPLHLLRDTQRSSASKAEPEGDPAAETAAASTSKRWRDIFKKGEEKEKKKKERKGGAGTGVVAADLNINIWPFSRSRSAGNAAARPRPSGAPLRKANSAPCSRSNSSGESKSRKCPASPGRAGIHLGRSSPVWQVRRTGGGAKTATADASRSSDGKTRVLNLSVPLCISSRHQMSCSGDNIRGTGRAAGGATGSATAGGGALLSLRSLFSKKVY